MNDITFYLTEQDLRGFCRYLQERENSPATIRKYLHDVRTFADYAGMDQPVNKERLLAYKEWLIGNYAVASANSMLVALNQFLVYMEKGRLRLKRIRVQRSDVGSVEKALDREEFQRLVRTARQNGREQTAMIMETMCATGIRSGLIFSTRTGKALNRSNIWKAMKRIGELAGVELKKVFPHNLRHLFARTFYRETKNLINLADILGHSNLDVTRGYASDGIREWKRNIEKLRLLEMTT